ncbi:response regulator transcription factor [Brevibacillus sp. NPDC003359]|uniref:response regulator transcription factor n=1 Tax=unclassified Brevibacillus TaxID=2684853 RepID=UPI0036AEEF6F
MASVTKVLLVEDDPEIGRIVRDHLQREGYAVTWASSGVEGWEDFQAQPFDIALIDLMLPEMDGFALCKHVRLTSDVPLLIMSARHEDEAKVRGLGVGADDYVTKPFSLTELSARITSHMRRYRRFLQKDGEAVEDASRYKYEGGLSVDFEKKEVHLNGESVSLTPKELGLLILLAGHPHRLFTKQELYEHIWGQADLEGNSTVTVHVKSLRGKLKDNKRDSRFIQTVWGSGYRFIGDQTT